MKDEKHIRVKISTQDKDDFKCLCVKNSTVKTMQEALSRYIKRCLHRGKIIR